jgi:hypothetical protein
MYAIAVDECNLFLYDTVRSLISGGSFFGDPLSSNLRTKYLVVAVTEGNFQARFSRRKSIEFPKLDRKISIERFLDVLNLVRRVFLRYERVLGYGDGGDVGDGSVGGLGGTFGEKRGPRAAGCPR